MVVAGLVAVRFALDLAAGVVVMVLTSSPIAWPGVGETQQSLGAGLRIMTTWSVGGALLGVLARGPALAVGLGVVWVLAVENLLRGAAQLLSGLAVVTDLLPGTAAGSPAAALGAAGTGDPSGTPGVAAVLDACPAAALLAGGRGGRGGHVPPPRRLSRGSGALEQQPGPDTIGRCGDRGGSRRESGPSARCAPASPRCSWSHSSRSSSSARRAMD